MYSPSLGCGGEPAQAGWEASSSWLFHLLECCPTRVAPVSKSKRRRQRHIKLGIVWAQRHTLDFYNKLSGIGDQGYLSIDHSESSATLTTSRSTMSCSTYRELSNDKFWRAAQDMHQTEGNTMYAIQFSRCIVDLKADLDLLPVPLAKAPYLLAITNGPEERLVQPACSTTIDSHIGDTPLKASTLLALVEELRSTTRTRLHEALQHKVRGVVDKSCFDMMINSLVTKRWITVHGDMIFTTDDNG